MKTSTTLNRINTLYSSHIVKIILLFFVIGTTTSVGQKSSIEFKVEKDRNTRSTTPDGTYYPMIITNTSKSADTFYFSSLNINSSCVNNDGSSTAKNVNLETVFLDKNLKSISEIKINAGETVSFFARVLVPKGTAFDKWCCTQVTAKSRLNPNYKVDTVLHTLVIDPNQDN